MLCFQYFVGRLLKQKHLTPIGLPYFLDTKEAQHFPRNLNYYNNPSLHAKKYTRKEDIFTGIEYRYYVSAIKSQIFHFLPVRPQFRLILNCSFLIFQKEDDVASQFLVHSNCSFKNKIAIVSSLFNIMSSVATENESTSSLSRQYFQCSFICCFIQTYPCNVQFQSMHHVRRLST